MIGQSIGTFSVSTYRPRGFIPAPPSTDGTSGGRGRIIHLRDKPLVFTDRPSEVHIDHIAPSIEEIKEELIDLETREVRMHHLLMAAKGAQSAAKQLQRLEAVQTRIRFKKAILDDEEALILILSHF